MNTSEEVKAVVEVIEKKLDAGISNYADDLATIRDRVKGLEQASAPGVPGATESKTLSGIVQKSDGFKSFMETTARQNIAIKVDSGLLTKNTITQESGSPLTPNDTLTQTARVPGIIGGAFRKLRIADLLPTFPTDSNRVDFTKESSFSNAAASQDGEGTAKAESTLTFSLGVADVATIAHYVKASKQALDDSAALQTYLDLRLRYGVSEKLDTDLLTGDGTSHAISGLLDTGNFQTFTPTSGDDAAASLRKCITELQKNDFVATGVVLHPDDWETIELLKDNQGNYIFGNPQEAAQPKVWGVPVVVSNAITSGKFLMADFPQAAALHVRQDATVQFGFENDDFTKNIVTILAELRAALTVYRPAAIFSGSLTV